MATSSIKRRSGGPLRSNIAGLYMICIEAEINGGTITSNDPQAGFTIASSGSGVYTITFDEDAKPRSVWVGIVLNEENDATEEARWTGYVASTGVGTFYFYDADVATNFVGTAKIMLLCSDSQLAD